MENRQGEGKNTIGNVEAKELTCMTHGHELTGWNAGERWVQGGIKGRKNWDIFDSIINKIYFEISIKILP